MKKFQSRDTSGKCVRQELGRASSSRGLYNPLANRFSGWRERDRTEQAKNKQMPFSDGKRWLCRGFCVLE
jgi:hypothetical protein